MRVLQEIESVGEPVVIKTNQSELNFDEWAGGITIKVRKLLKEKTGRENAKGFQDKPFVCSATELKNRLKTYQKKYKGMFNSQKIESMILSYTQECINKKSFSPVLMYYITHESRGSRLADEYEDFGKEEVEITTKEIGAIDI